MDDVQHIDPTIDLSKAVKFSGSLSATAMICLHFPPDSVAGNLSLVDQQAASLRLLYSKLGLDVSGDIASRLCWLDMICLKTDLAHRATNSKRPYEVAWSPALLSRAASLANQAIDASQCRVRLVVAGEIVLQEIAKAKADDDCVLFSLPDPESGKVISQFGQKYHGCWNKSKFRTR